MASPFLPVLPKGVDSVTCASAAIRLSALSQQHIMPQLPMLCHCKVFSFQSLQIFSFSVYRKLYVSKLYISMVINNKYNKNVKLIELYVQGSQLQK